MNDKSVIILNDKNKTEVEIYDNLLLMTDARNMLVVLRKEIRQFKEIKTGKIIGENCYGEEKVKRFYEAGYNKDSIDEFYSDSLSDSPLADISKTAYIVIKEKLVPWNEYKK